MTDQPFFTFLKKKFFTKREVWLYVESHPPTLQEEQIAFDLGITLQYVNLNNQVGRHLSPLETLDLYLRRPHSPFEGIITSDAQAILFYARFTKMGLFVKLSKNNQSERVLKRYDYRHNTSHPPL